MPWGWGQPQRGWGFMALPQIQSVSPRIALSTSCQCHPQLLPSSHWPLADKICVQLPMHRQGRIQEKLHSNSESFFRHVNSQKILLEAQTPVSNQCPRHRDKQTEPGKPQETAFKTWSNGEPINWHHQVKICFSQTSFVTPPQPQTQ